MLTQKLLKKHLHYDPSTGIFTRLTTASNNAKAGSTPGNIDAYGYSIFSFMGKKYKAHRLAWLYVYGVWPIELDHQNHIRDDNRISNLREVSRKQNMQNTKLYTSNSSGSVGVCWDKSRNRWMAQIRVSGKTVVLGRYKEIKDAIQARRDANTKYGFHKNHGMIHA